jgi:DNA mismatch endonuclease (patch repair protein)
MDSVSPEIRSYTMSRVPRRDTTPERALRRALWRRGVRGWRLEARRLPGKPDLVFWGRKLAVFVDGAFWHGHPSRFTQGQSGTYWDEKIARNRDRDRRVTAELRALGWRVLRVWDFEVLADPDEAARRVEALLGEDQVGGDRPPERVG